MEVIEKVFYRKINPSDFKKMYDIDKPETGGGQTYLEAAGIDTDSLVDFLSYGEISDSPLKNEERKIYTINAYVLGKTGKESQCAQLEFAPRGGRNNYRISRQTMALKHPAWKIDNNFPEPQRDEMGKYKNTFDGVIDNLVITIIRTSYRKYYAGFINEGTIPTEWPLDIGLENIFQGEKRGIIDLSGFNILFQNDFEYPFGIVEHIIISSSKNEEKQKNRIIFGAPGTGKSHTLEEDSKLFGNNMERVTFHPNYSYASFVGTYKPVMAKNEMDWYIDDDKKKVISVLQDKSMTAQEKYDLLYEKFKDKDLTRLPLLLGIYTDESFKTKKQDGTDAVGDNGVERNHGKAIRPYLNLEPQKNNNEISYEYVPGPFMRIYTQAINHPEDNYLLLIEEINRANVAAVFGDVFQLLDRKNGVSEYPIATSEDIKKFLMDNLDCLKGKCISELSDEEKEMYLEMRIPNNVYIWATMNSADQGVFPMDTAFKRRWEFEYIGIDAERDMVKDYVIPVGMGENRHYIHWNELREGINGVLSKEENRVNEDKLLGPFFISKPVLDNMSSALGDTEAEDAFVKSFESKVIMYLFEDVMKMRPEKIFIGCKDKKLFSKICEAFETDGEKIFGLNDIEAVSISKDVDSTEE